VKSCEACRTQFGRRHKEGVQTFARRRFCSHACAETRNRKQLWHRVEDVELLLQAGESPQRICERLEAPPSALFKLLYRYGHSDLARAFNAAQRAQYPRRTRSAA
jgi:hypothetical protein